jgi:membrane-anchored mycosin MYCP
MGVAMMITAAVFMVAPPTPPAAAIAPPAVDPRLTPRPGPPQPPEATEQRSQCAVPVLSGEVPRTAPTAQRMLDLPTAWQFSRGAGQTVAVIDTGVNRHPRLPILIPGGDYVSNSDGTSDCDGHGTFVAGIIAARPSPGDGFTGVAPDAAILSIRQLSLEFSAKNSGQADGAGAMASGGFGNVATLASAIVRAVDMGATVINMSEVSCAPAGTDLQDGALGAAIEYAYNRNVVMVAAAGNVQSDGACKAQNDGTGWDQVKTVASPAWFAPYVLSVASTDPDGKVSDFSLDGPWVSVAAPGTGLVSLDSRPGGTGLVDGIPTPDGPPSPINGTSFSSAFVAGVAALVRSRFPALSARQVMDRIIRTAHTPGPGRDDRLGYGTVDAVAALTAQLPDHPVTAAGGRRLPPDPTAPRIDPLPERIAIIGTLACLVALVLGSAAGIAVRRGSRRRTTADMDPDLGDRTGFRVSVSAADEH